MSDALSFDEIDEQHVELLPARTVMSMFATGKGGGFGDLQVGDIGDVPDVVTLSLPFTISGFGG